MRAECVVSWIYSHLFISARHIRLQNMSTVLHTTVLDNQVANSLNCLLDGNQTQDHTEKSGFWAALTSPWHPQNHLILGCSEKKLPTSQIKSISFFCPSLTSVAEEFQQWYDYSLCLSQGDLSEALDGLEAASRLSEQLDRKEEALAALKEEGRWPEKHYFVSAVSQQFVIACCSVCWLPSTKIYIQASCCSVCWLTSTKICVQALCWLTSIKICVQAPEVVGLGFSLQVRLWVRPASNNG